MSKGGLSAKQSTMPLSWIFFVWSPAGKVNSSSSIKMICFRPFFCTSNHWINWGKVCVGSEAKYEKKMAL